MVTIATGVIRHLCLQKQMVLENKNLFQILGQANSNIDGA